MKKIKCYKTFRPFYRTLTDGTLEELIVSIRQYPKDRKRNLSFVLERKMYTQSDTPLGYKEAASDKPHIEIYQSPIGDGKTIKDILPLAEKSVMLAAAEQNYTETPPSWFRTK